ncbi:MAG: hypothetical protein JWL62_980 [Hyphomicrobiales bacterium]|nr:hypothetical protein [Hyphomicrobiales bacterium]
MNERAFLPLAIILALPLLAFDAGFLNTGPGLASAGLLIAALIVAMRGVSAAPPIDWRLMAPCLALGLLLILISGAGHFFYQTDDWTIRDGLLADLARQPWPYAYEVDGKLQMLRAPLGLYLAPAAVGKLFGLMAADLAMLAQNGTITGLVLYIFAREAGARRGQMIILAVFVLFAGLDIVPTLGQLIRGDTFNPHPDSWSGLEYSAHMTLLFWVPNHALAGWSFAAAYVAWRRGALRLGHLGLFFALALFWSPLAAMGALLLLLFAAVCALRHGPFPWREIPLAALAGLAALPVFLFMTRGAGEVPSGFMSGSLFYALYGGLLLVDVVPPLVFVWQDIRYAKNARARWEFAIVAGAMVLFPFYSLGIGNDFARRAIIPLMAVLAIAFAQALLRTLETGFGTQRRWVIPVMVLAALNPAVELMKNVIYPATPFSTCNLLDAWQSGPDRDLPMSAYFSGPAGFAVPAGLFRPPAGEPVQAQGRHCWGDGKRPFIFGGPVLDSGVK